MAFGFDDKEIQRAATRRQATRRLAIGIPVGLVALLIIAGIAGLQVFGSAAGLGRITEQMAQRAGIQVTFDTVDVDKSASFWRPMTWHATFHGVNASKPGGGPAVHADSLSLGVDDLFSAWRGADPRIFEEVEVTGIEVNLPMQPPLPDPTEEGPTWLVRSLKVAGRVVRAAPDDLRPGAEAVSFSGTFENTRWTEGAHILSGKGSGKVERLTVGEHVAEQIDLAEIVMKDSTIGFSGTASVFGTPSKIVGQFKHLQRHGELVLSLEPEPMPVEEVLEGAFGVGELIRGRFEGKILVQAGGERPRGGAVVTLDGAIFGPVLHLGNPDGVKTLLKQIPTLVAIEGEPGQAGFPDLSGEIHHDLEGTDIDRLVFDGPLQTRLRGRLGPEPLVVVRSVNSLEYWLYPGKGAILTRGEEGWQVRKATDKELLPPKPVPDPGQQPAPMPATGG